MRTCILVVPVCLTVAVVQAAPPRPLEVASIFGDHMVLQRGVKVPVWGMAAPGERVTVTIGAQTAAGTADGQGRWLVRLGPLDPGGPVTLAIEGKGRTRKIVDVLVGEVWVCSGQSNMAWPLAKSAGGVTDLPAADLPQVRLFTVGTAPAYEPATTCSGRWFVCTPTTAGPFSAVGYYFGREIHEALKVPVGLINASCGGTPAESWISRKGLEGDPVLRPITAQLDAAMKLRESAEALYRAALERWKQVTVEDHAQGRPGPPAPRRPAGLVPGPGVPTALFNGMIHPLIPFAIQGAIWYQGESNTSRAQAYRTLFPAMIRDWRRAWGRGDFPFLFVQLPNYGSSTSQPVEKSAWAELREAQAAALALPRTGMAVTIDGGDPDLHPREKREVGRRLALLARSIAYGQDVPCSGPLFESMRIDGDAIRVRFTHTYDGLSTKSGGPVLGFAVAGSDGAFAAAQATIEGDAVVVRSDKVPAPTAVRYAWANNPAVNLVNSAGLPAAPFRSDAPPAATRPSP